MYMFNILTHIHTRTIHSHTYIHAHVHTLTHSHTHTHTHTHTHIHTYTHTLVHTHTHSLSHTRTHTHAHTYSTQCRIDYNTHTIHTQKFSKSQKSARDLTVQGGVESLDALSL